MLDVPFFKVRLFLYPNGCRAPPLVQICKLQNFKFRLEAFLMEEKRFYIKVGSEKVFVSETLFKQYMKMQRQEQYHAARDKEKGLIHYDSWDAEKNNGEEVCVDRNFNTEEQALAAIEAEKIWQCVQKLQDQYQICRLVAEGYTEREIAEMLGISQNSVHMRKKSLFRRLRKMLKK